MFEAETDHTAVLDATRLVGNESGLSDEDMALAAASLVTMRFSLTLPQPIVSAEGGEGGPTISQDRRSVTWTLPLNQSLRLRAESEPMRTVQPATLLVRAIRLPPTVALTPLIQDGPHAVAAVTEAKRDRLALPARPDRYGPVHDPWHRNPPNRPIGRSDPAAPGRFESAEGRDPGWGAQGRERSTPAGYSRTPKPPACRRA